MSEVYAANIENGIVSQVIVGTATWASKNLGGIWVDSNVPVWVGGTWDSVNGFRPPKPSENFVWDNGAWVLPE